MLAEQLQRLNPEIVDQHLADELVHRLARVPPSLQGNLDACEYLRGIRKASENWLGRSVMGAVMALLAGSFAIWGINDIFRGFGRASLAKIGDTEIPIEQFRQTYQDRLQQIGRELGRPLPAGSADVRGLDRLVLGEMIAQAGLDQRARQMGLGLSDADIANHIRSDPKLQTANGQFDRAKFDLILRNIGYSEQRFVAPSAQSSL